MTQDEIIKMAIQAELNLYVHDLTEKQYIQVIETFAKLVADKEREACAKMVEDSWMAFARRSNRLDITPFPELDYVAKVIRARGEV